MEEYLMLVTEVAYINGSNGHREDRKLLVCSDNNDQILSLTLWANKGPKAQWLVCIGEKLFIHCFTGYRGSVHDARVFFKSEVNGFLKI